MDLEARNQGVGGSEVAAILGLSPWTTAYEVWQRKLGLSNGTPDNPAMAYGRMMESVIRQWYSDETGRLVTVPPGSMTHPKHPFVLASLDGITEDDRVLEIKTARSSDGWGEPGTDAIPVYYQTQVQQYMLVTGLPVADVAVSIAGTMPLIYEVPADIELQQMILEAVIEFWKLVETKTPPEPVSYADMIARFGRHSIAASVKASADAIEAASRLKAVRSTLKTLEAEEEALKAVLMGELGENEQLLGLDGKPLCTWKLPKAGTVFDAKQFQLEHEELYRQYLVDKEGSRRFLLK